MGQSLLLAFSFVILNVVNQAYSQGDAGCPIDFTPYGDSCYHIFATPTLNWWSAMSFCAVYGNGKGSLAIVESSDEQLFLEGEMKRLYPTAVGKDFWLGANDIIKDGTFVWVKINQYVQEYTRWAPGQPSSGTAENCLALYDGVNYMWNDAPCNLPEGFICEVPNTGSSEIIG